MTYKSVIAVLLVVLQSVTYTTNASDPDSDGDGYWDGWIGVYGVERTENVVLYMEHVQNGIQTGEIVQEQIGVHEASAAPSATSATLAGTAVHSNIHVGELQWNTDPTDGSTSTVDVTVEADFRQGLPERALNSSTWGEGIERNYRLYGIDLDIKRDDTFPSSVPYVVSDMDSDLYLLVTTELALSGDTWGFNAEASARTLPVLPTNGHIVYAKPISDAANNLVSQRNVNNSPYSTKTEVLAAFVEMHELGHSFDIGRADDLPVPLPPGEVYSGLKTNRSFSKPNDDTPEQVPIRGDTEIEWSIMRLGWSQDSLIQYNGVTYYVFSIEELNTINDPDT